MTKRILFYCMMVFCLSGMAEANDFGPMFINEAPQALAPAAESNDLMDAFMSMDNMAEELQNIMPAAGDDIGANDTVDDKNQTSSPFPDLDRPIEASE